MRILDSRLHGNDLKEHFKTFYEAANIDALVFFTQFRRRIENVQECRQMNDCTHALHCRLDGRMIRYIANNNLNALREYTCGRS